MSPQHLFASAAAVLESPNVELAKGYDYTFTYEGVLTAASLYGAVKLVAERNEDVHAEMLHDLWCVLGESPIGWNDSPEREKVEVLELLQTLSKTPTMTSQLRTALSNMIAKHWCACATCLEARRLLR